MSQTIPLRQGGCRCGEVRFEITAPPILTMACHCTGCQRMTASAFSLSVAIAPDGFAVTDGEPVIGGLQGPTRHFHCPRCLSWMFTRPEGVDWIVNVRSTLLDELISSICPASGGQMSATSVAGTRSGAQSLEAETGRTLRHPWRRNLLNEKHSQES